MVIKEINTMCFEKVYLDGMFETIDNPDYPLIGFDGYYWASINDSDMHVITSEVTYPDNNEVRMLDHVSLLPLTI